MFKRMVLKSVLGEVQRLEKLQKSETLELIL